VSHVGFGFVGFFGRVVRDFLWVWRVCWVGVPSGQIWVFDRSFNCYLGFEFHLCFGCCGCLSPCGFFWVLFCGLAGLFLCILPMYLGAPYAF
jgi:hypothetical protein